LSSAHSGAKSKSIGAPPEEILSPTGTGEGGGGGGRGGGGGGHNSNLNNFPQAIEEAKVCVCVKESARERAGERASEKDKDKDKDKDKEPNLCFSCNDIHKHTLSGVSVCVSISMSVSVSCSGTVPSCVCIRAC
jgi:hypothetical protein